jgi:DNA (cytosine-5)-methyltransferase 1
MTGGPESAERKQQLGRTESGGGDLQAAVKLWPTATAGDGKAGGSRNAPGSKAHQGVSLSDAAITGNSSGRQGHKVTGAESRRVLNPRFVEWLMGFPPGWTDFEPLEIPAFLSWRQKHSYLLRGQANE